MTEQRKRMKGAEVLARIDQISVANARVQTLLDALYKDLEATRPPSAAPPDPNRRPATPAKGAAARAMRGGTPGM